MAHTRAQGLTHVLPPLHLPFRALARILFTFGDQGLQQDLVKLSLQSGVESNLAAEWTFSLRGYVPRYSTSGSTTGTRVQGHTHTCNGDVRLIHGGIYTVETPKSSLK